MMSAMSDTYDVDPVKTNLTKKSAVLAGSELRNKRINV